MVTLTQKARYVCTAVYGRELRLLLRLTLASRVCLRLLAMIFWSLGLAKCFLSTLRGFVTIAVSFASRVVFFLRSRGFFASLRERIAGFFVFPITVGVCSYPQDFDCSFQDGATPIMEGLVDLHQDILFFLIVIATFVFWVLGTVLFKFYGSGSANCRRSRLLAHHDPIEVFWTMCPAFVMILIALPSFALLYSVDEVVAAAVTVKVIGRQWYWHYEYLFASELAPAAGVFSSMVQDSSMSLRSSNEAPVVWVYHSVWEARARANAASFETLGLRPFLKELPAVTLADCWLNSWFPGYTAIAYRDDRIIAERRQLFSATKYYPLPQTMQPSEVSVYQLEKLPALFDVLQAHGVTQDVAVRGIREALGAYTMAAALDADRDAWNALHRFFVDWASALTGGGSPASLVQSIRGESNESLTRLNFDSYLLAADDAPRHLRLLAADRPLIIPVRTFVRFLITSSDVLHSWAVPALGVKVDACPGRLNQVIVFVDRLGDFFGQCSEICGVNHGFMPIHLRAVDNHEYFKFTVESSTKDSFALYSTSEPVPDTSKARKEEDKKEEERDTTLRNVIIGLIGLLGVAFAVWYFWKGPGSNSNNNDAPGGGGGGGQAQQLINQAEQQLQQLRELRQRAEGSSNASSSAASNVGNIGSGGSSDVAASAVDMAVSSDAAAAAVRAVSDVAQTFLHVNPIPTSAAFNAAYALAVAASGSLAMFQSIHAIMGVDFVPMAHFMTDLTQARVPHPATIETALAYRFGSMNAAFSEVVRDVVIQFPGRFVTYLRHIHRIDFLLQYRLVSGEGSTAVTESGRSVAMLRLYQSYADLQVAAMWGEALLQDLHHFRLLMPVNRLIAPFYPHAELDIVEALRVVNHYRDLLESMYPDFAERWRVYHLPMISELDTRYPSFSGNMLYSDIPDLNVRKDDEN